MGEEGLDLFDAHVFGMTFIVKKDVTFDPVFVGLFGAVGVVLGLKGVAHTFDKLSASLVKQFFPRRGGCALRLNGGGVWDWHIGFGKCIIVKVFLINHQEGRNRDIITIFFPINHRTRVFSGLYASYKRFAWKICG